MMVVGKPDLSSLELPHREMNARSIRSDWKLQPQGECAASSAEQGKLCMVTLALNASSRRSHIGTIDGVAGICFCRGRGKIQLGGIARVHAIKWFSLFDLITDLLEQPDPCTLSMGAPAVRARRFNCRQSIPETVPSITP